MVNENIPVKEIISASDEDEASSLISEFDSDFKSLDRACSILDKTLDNLAQSPSPFVH